MSEIVCPNCGNSYVGIANHWASSSNCDYPRTPQAVIEMSYAAISGRGRVNQRPDGKRPHIEVRLQATEDNKNRLETLQSYLGVYANSLSDVFHERTGEFSDKEFTDSRYRLTLKPISEIRSTPDWSSYTPSFLFTKTFLHLYGDFKERTIQVRLGSSSNPPVNLLNTLFKHHRVDDNHPELGDGQHVFSSPISEFEPVLESEWPTGWWNDSLRCESPPPR